MTRRLIGSYLLIATVVLATLAIPLGMVAARLERSELVTALERDAVVIGNRVEEALERGATEIDPNIDAYLERSEARVVIVDSDGISVFDPSSDADVRRDYSTRPEVAAALSGERSVGTRQSTTLGTGLLFVAVPVASQDTVHGAVRLTHTTAEVDDRIRSVWVLLGGICLLSLAATALVGMRIASWVTAPTRRLAAAVQAFTNGDTDARAATDAGPPEIRDLADRFNRMATRLTQLLQSQQQFIADASHQLRSPLAAVRLELEGALAQDDEGRQIDREGVQRAAEEAQRLSRVIDGLLALARAESSEVDVGGVDVDRVVAGRVELWGPLAEEHAVMLSADPGTPCTALAVEGHLEQVLDNLIANALDITPEGGHVVLAWHTDDGDVVVTVTDDGPGMDDPDLTQAFERFWRGPGPAAGPRDAPTPGGSGLGLSIARELVRVAGGEVRLRHAHGTPGSGIRAEVRLREKR